MQISPADVHASIGLDEMKGRGTVAGALLLPDVLCHWEHYCRDKHRLAYAGPACPTTLSAAAVITQLLRHPGHHGRQGHYMCVCACMWGACLLSYRLHLIYICNAKMGFYFDV